MPKNILKSLIGKTIVDIKMKEIDQHGDDQNIKQVYKIITTDGIEHYFACESGNEQQYARLEKYDHVDDW